KPTVSTFTATTPSTSRNIQITDFTATDNVAVTGYMITASATPPLAGDAGWTGTAPATYTVVSDGTYTLYPWAKDALGNVSNVFGSPRTVVVDTAPPTGLAASTPADEAADLPINTTVNSTTATDPNGPVQYYFEVSDDVAFLTNVQTGGWQAGTSYAPTLANGVTYYWQVKARDAAGNQTAFTIARFFSTVGPCVRNDPTLTLNPTQQTIVTNGGTKDYTLTIRNNDYGDCGNTTFNFSVSDIDTENNFDAPILSSSTALLAPGAQTTRTVTVTATAGKLVGQSLTKVTSAADAFHAQVLSNNGGYVTTYLNVVECNANTPNLVIGPDAANVAVGGSHDYTVTVQNNDTGAGCSAVTYNIAIFSESNVPSAHFNTSTLSLSSKDLTQGQKGSVTLTVSAKAGATLGQVNITTIRVTATGHTSPADKTATTTVGNSILHNSTNTGSTRWSSAGGWGIVGGKYGEFDCTTCHTTSDTTNIKKIRTSITTPDASQGALPGDGQPIVFDRPAGTKDQGVFGFDSGGATPRTTSSKICEICHTYDAGLTNGVKAHPYNSAGNTLSNHQNADGTDCTFCHKHNKGFMPPACDSCHGNPPGALASSPFITGSATAGKHTTHVTTLSYTCVMCHGSSYQMPEESTALPGQGDIDISFAAFGSTTGSYSGQTGVSYNNVAGTGGLTCSTVYCHGSTLDGTATTPAWTGTVACGNCHKATAANPPSLGNHPRHSGSGAAQLNIACTDCHGTNGNGGTGHVTGKIEWNLNIANGKFGTSAKYNSLASGTINNLAPSSSYQGCATIYCHSNAQNSTGTAGPTSYGTPTWGGSALTCTEASGCHNNPPATGNHVTHVTTKSFTCSVCHNGAGDETASHANNIINMSIDTTYGGTYSQGDHAPGSGGFGTCNTVYCHSQGTSTTSPFGGAPNTTATWNGAVMTCEGCHNFNAAATNKMATGKHTEHMNNSAVLGTNYGCQECHNTTTTDGTSITNQANHVNRTRDVSMVKGGTWTSPNCTTTYCHSTGQATPTSVNPGTWTAGAALGCDSCHGTEGGTAFGEPAYANGSQPTVVENNDNSHSAHVTVAADCARCHTDTVDTAGTAIKTGSLLHTNQTRNLNFAAAYDTNGGTNSDNYNGATKTCSAISCHGAGTPMWGGAALLCDQCHLANNTLAGKHGKHYGVATIAVTADKTPSNTSSGTVYEFSCGVCHYNTPHSDGNVSANQAAQVAFDSTIAVGGSYAAGALAGTDTGGRNWTNGTCSTTYCHSQGTSTTTPFGGAPNTAATWNGAAMTCEGCHNFNAAATNKMATGKHTAHMNDGTIMPNVACSACHTSTTSDSTTITNEASHVNNVKDVTIAATYDSDATPGNNWASNQCSNVYCHSTGEATPTYKTVLWSATISDCKSCHNYDVASGTIMATGKHTEHINNSAVLGTNYGCQECHNSTTTNGTSITTPANHVNKTRDVSMVKGGTWTSPNCTAVYCHSSGQATPAYVNPGTWTAGAALGCDNCHGTEGGTSFGEPAYASGGSGTATANSHSAHVTSAADCTSCHTDTVTTAGTAIKAASILHTNQTRNLNFAAAYDTNGGTNSDNYNTGTKTCSAIICHGTGIQKVWGAVTTNNSCTKCHGTGTIGTVDGTNRYVVAPPVSVAGNTGILTGTGQVSDDAKVGAHQTHLRLLNGLQSSAVESLDTRCQNCHGTIPGTGDITHANGTSSPAFQGLATKSGAMLPTYVGTTCNNTYCHNPAGTGGTLNTANTGTGTAPVWTNAAYVADGTLKTIANCGVCHKSPWDAGFTASYSHGALTTADDCAGCHGHNGETSGIAGQRHMDGVKYGAGGSCNSCHGYGPSATDGKPERSGVPEGKGAHEKHVTYLVTKWGGTLNPATDAFGSGASWTNVCGVCHNGASHNMSESIPGTGRTISVPTTYQFGLSAPVYNGTVGVSSGTTPKTCSNISCHFSTTPVWSAY
ncbi:MAG: CxxxxCH/CxxCH domain-containing protein, partial [Nitrospirae bacterium]|nr:CxxxxCH/CxxCH domain-containing protein [Nitrospirota bacterium]